MRSSLQNYRRLFYTVLVAAMILMAAVVGCFSLRFMRAQAEREVGSAALKAVNMLRTYDPDDDDGLELITENLRKGAEWTDAETIVFDEDGVALAGSEATPLTERRLSTHTLELIDDHMSSFSVLDGFFDSTRVSVIYRTETDEGTFYVLSSLDAKFFNIYISYMLIIAVIAFSVIFFVSAVLINFHVKRYAEPLKKMTLAAKRFGAGDFSEKVEVADHNEIGFLASTLNEMAASLEEIEETRKSFISNVSHELKTPMTTIGGFVDGILDGTIPESERRRYLRTVSEETQRLSRLVRSMLNISKYESGEIALVRKEFDLTTLTIKTVLLFEHRIDDKKVDIRGLDAPVFTVNADPDLIQQVIYNLTENAVKFVDEGGYIEYSFFTDEGKTHLSIKNSGGGLRKNEMNKVFDRFYKTDESRGKDTTGVGLGLSIVRSIIKLHDGNILVRSKEGEYTEFEFSI